MLFLYSGKRNLRGQPGVDFSDTQLYGLNHMDKFGIDAVSKDDFQWVGRFVSGPVGFRLRHFLSFFSTLRYDIVFGSSILYFAPLKKLLRSRTRYVLFNLNAVRILLARERNRLRFRIIRFALLQMNAIVSVSHAQNRELQELIPELAGKLHFIPLGADTRYFQAVYEGRTDIILSVGRDNGRDYKTVIEVAKLLPERPFEIICSRRNLEGIGNIPANVKIYYDLNPEELKKKYQSAQLLLLITHSDSFADGSDCSGQTVLLDACVNGLPVIATRKQYIADYLQEGNDVEIVEPYDAKHILEKISKLKSPEVRRTMAERARKAAEGFSTERFAERLSGLCRSLS
jgi:glycosyltransferase involved in cell wall biosynthesis